MAAAQDAASSKLCERPVTQRAACLLIPHDEDEDPDAVGDFRGKAVKSRSSRMRTRLQARAAARFGPVRWRTFMGVRGRSITAVETMDGRARRFDLMAPGRFSPGKPRSWFSSAACIRNLPRDGRPRGK